MGKWKWFCISIVCATVAFILLFFGLRVMEPKSDEEMDLPRVDIILNGVTLEEINTGEKEVKYGGNEVAVIDDDISSVFYDVEIKGRGNGTWSPNKKPYQIKFSEKVDLFGFGKSRKWYLLSNKLDDTSLRNDLTLMLSRMLDIKPTLKGRFVELYVGGEYEGLYYLTQALEINKNIVNLKDSMGILVELDNLYGWAEDDNYVADNNDVLTIKDVVNYDERDKAMKLFLKDFNLLWQAIEKRDYDAIKDLIDVDSFVKYYLLSELIVNPDAYVTSCYFYKDGEADKIHAGPAWDFDLVFGNKMWNAVLKEEFYSPYNVMVRKKEAYGWVVHNESGEAVEEFKGNLSISRIYFELMEIPEFRDRVDDMYEEKLAGKEGEVLEYFDHMARTLRSEILRDNEKWEKGDFDSEVEYVRDWIIKRFNSFEYEYGGFKKLHNLIVEI